MSDWDDIKTIRKNLIERWEKGRFFHDVEFPYSFPIKSPKNNDISFRFYEVGEWILRIQEEFNCQNSGWRLDYRSFPNRVHGTQQLPFRVCFDLVEALADFVGKKKELECYRRAFKRVVDTFPDLETWCTKYPLRLLHYAEEWDKLLCVITYFLENPKSGIYLRQVCLPGIHTKYIESRKRLIDELLLCIKNDDIEMLEIQKTESFEEKWGIRAKESRIRFRILDPEFAIGGLRDLEIPISEFKNLELSVETAFITENEINGLCFPDYPKAIVVFGLGYALDSLSTVDWLKNTTIYYWGDLDTHGFAMLDRMRSHFPLVRSILMDATTWNQHSSFRVLETAPCHSLLKRLTEEEYRLYQQLVTLSDQQESSRLEQELIAYEYLESYLRAL